MTLPVWQQALASVLGTQLAYLLSNLPYFLLMVSVIVVFHELGHFVVAKLCRVQVTRFSIGFGPTLLHHTHGDTVYQLCLLPLGGYVKMLGDASEVEVAPELRPWAFSHKPVWQRTAIVLAGPAANLLLAFFVYAGLGVGTHAVPDSRLGLVNPGEPAALAGLQPGDRIVAVAGSSVEDWVTLREAVAKRPHQAMPVTYERVVAGEVQRLQTVVQTGSRSEPGPFGELQTRGMVGVSMQYLRPVVAVVDPTSPAARAGVHSGDTVVAVGTQPVDSWHVLRQRLAAWRDARLPLQLQDGNQRMRSVELQPAAWPAGLRHDLESAADLPQAYTGLVSQDTVVAELEAGGAALRADLRLGDRLLALQEEDPQGTQTTRAIHVWEVDLAPLALAADRRLTLSVQRGDKVLALSLPRVVLADREALADAPPQLRFGARNAGDLLVSYTRPRTTGTRQAASEALARVADDAQLIARGLLRLVRGSLPLSTMGGPIMLFVVAERSAHLGLAFYLQTLAVISVNVGLVNLLPVPVLDGGHLSFFFLEAITGRPPSPRLRLLAQTVGLVLLLSLMLFTLGHDAWRYILQ